jgi:hypothetical protein
VPELEAEDRPNMPPPDGFSIKVLGLKAEGVPNKLPPDEFCADELKSEGVLEELSDVLADFTGGDQEPGDFLDHQTWQSKESWMQLSPSFFVTFQ